MSSTPDAAQPGATTPAGQPSSAAPAGGEHRDHSADLQAYLRVFLALMVLTAVTVGVSFVDLGTWNDVVAMAVAITKAVLVIWIFMHVRESSRLTLIFAGLGFFWLLIFLVFIFADYAARGWLPIYTAS